MECASLLVAELERLVLLQQLAKRPRDLRVTLYILNLRKYPASPRKRCSCLGVGNLLKFASAAVFSVDCAIHPSSTT